MWGNPCLFQAGTFEHAISLPTPRTDAPMHLGPAPKPTLPPHIEAARPLNDLQIDIAGVLSHLTATEPSFSRGGDGLGPPVLQGAVSEWFQDRVREHGARTTEWRSSKSGGLPIVCQAIPKSGWREHSWVAAGAVQRPEPATTTISTKTLRSTGTGTPYCLDAGAGAAGAVVSATVCYPTADTASNRDPSQQWVIRPDATIRPRADDALCLTASIVELFSFFSTGKHSLNPTKMTVPADIPCCKCLVFPRPTTRWPSCT